MLAWNGKNGSVKNNIFLQDQLFDFLAQLLLEVPKSIHKGVS